mmetsp:Transcript_28533/g.60216  ORF Transcript_28533/g.60216 Transcript_28533/m.60216 type:complete len:385 (+) Transcript_28533:50-1204(+)
MATTTTTADSNSTITESTGIFFLPSHVTPLNYLFFLTLCLIAFLGYLLLPRGIKAQYCGGARRRYLRQRQKQTRHSKQIQHQSLRKEPQPEDILGNIYAYSHSFSPQDEVGRLVGGNADSPSSGQMKSGFISSQASALDSLWSGVDESQGSEASSKASDKQQQQLSLPQILKEMLKQPPGIKFVAHGTKCKPRSVWITLHSDKNNSQSTPLEYQNCLTWRAELKTSSSQQNSPSPMISPGTRMGNLRKVELNAILGIERGKRTTALRRVQTAKGVDENECFSLLTKTGTLDLECTGLDVAGGQLSAEEVRAAFITCLALALSSRGLQLNGLQSLSAGGTPRSLESQLNGLNGASPTSHSAALWDENTLFTGLMSEPKTISTVSF